MGANLVSLAQDILSFCATAKKGEKMLYVTPPDYNKPYADAMMEAAENLGLEALHLIPWASSSGRKYLPHRDGRSKWMWSTFKTSDLIIDCTLDGRPGYPGAVPEYCDEFSNLFEESDTRVLMITVPAPSQRQLFPAEERFKRGLAAGEAITKAKTMRFKSAAGTDLIMKKEGRPGHVQMSMVDKEHRWDNFGYDCAECCPLEDGVNGTLVLEPQDLITSLPGDQYVTDNVKLTFKNGYVTKIEGGYTAARFRSFMERASLRGKDKESYGGCHFGWGISHEATPGTGSRQELAAYHHSAAGSVMVALGMSYGFASRSWKYFGLLGTRKAASHTHMTLFNLDVYLDDEMVVEKGKIIKPGF